MKYPIDKKKWMAVFAANFGEHYNEVAREMGEAVVDCLNQAYYAGFEDGRKAVQA